MNNSSAVCQAIYGPVLSWRFGRSLGIDAIGAVSTCSFNCAYCQLGEIQQRTMERRVFVSTDQIQRELDTLSPLALLDVVTLSGSGEPTLALNLGEILTCLHRYFPCPVVVLTNGTLLGDTTVQSELRQADEVVVKIDAVWDQHLQRVNRPVSDLTFAKILPGIRSFASTYPGKWAVQTMMLAPWSPEERSQYIQLLTQLNPSEVQLNIPSRPRVTERQLDARGNQVTTVIPTILQPLNCVSIDILKEFAAEIKSATDIPVRYPQQSST